MAQDNNAFLINPSARPTLEPRGLIQIKLLKQQGLQLRRQYFPKLLDLVGVDLICDGRKHGLDLRLHVGAEATACFILDGGEEIFEVTGFRLRLCSAASLRNRSRE